MLIKADETIRGNPGDDSHFVRFYDDNAVLMGEVADFLDCALRAGGAAIVIADAAHLEEVRHRLAGLGSSPNLPAWYPGELILLDAEQTLARFMVDGWPDPQRFAATVGSVVAAACANGRTVHAFGEMVALLCAQGQYDAAVRLEQLWNDLAQEHAFSLFCAYPWTQFATSEQADAFERVCAEHKHCCSQAPVSGTAADRAANTRLVKLEQKALALEAEVVRRKEAEHTLRKREKELADFVENAAEGLHRVGADGTILWANTAELRMLGYRWEEYVGHHITEFHIDAPVIARILRQLKSGDTLYDLPARLRCKDGSIKHVVIQSNACFENGTLRYTRCFTRDATERHERDQALAQRDSMLLNAPVAAALLMGPELTFRLANRRFCQLLGRTGLEGTSFADAVPELFDTEVMHLLQRASRTGEPFCAEELRLVLGGAGGEPAERFFKFSLEPLTQGNEHGVIVVAVEVTEHVRARQALERVQVEREELLAQLTAANNAKDEFLAMLGHELRNPLSPIVTALQLMRMRGESGALRERQIIERQVDHLVRLVDDLLDISRVTRGNITLKPEQVEIAQPLAKAVEMAGLLLEQRRHRLIVEVAPELHWHGDPARLAQVVANLLTNAARYTEPGGEIVLRARREDPSLLCISVKDSGIGLAPEVLAQVFDLFFQGKRSLDRTEGGLGVGLALVKNIVELHGGTVEAKSQGKGTGSEFIVRLPARGAPALTANVPDLALPAAAPSATRRIMIVDDNADGAEMLGRLLGAHGHVVEVFNDPLQALAEAQRLRPDIAVLDIGLPVLDGYELGARLRALLGEHSCRLIALTGYGQEADKTRSAEAGFERHLVKPVSPEHIVGVVSGP